MVDVVYSLKTYSRGDWFATMKRRHWSRNTCHLNRGKLEFPIESLLTGQWNKWDTTSNKSGWMCSAEHLQKCWSIPWQPVSNSLGRPHFDPWDIFPSKRWGENTYFHQCCWLLYPRFIRTPLVPHGSKFTTQEGCNSCSFHDWISWNFGAPREQIARQR